MGKKLLCKPLYALFLMFSCLPAYAGYGSGDINRFYVTSSGWAYFGLKIQLPNTCSSWGEHFRFDTSLPGGSNMLSVLMAAKLAGQKVTVWYQDSSAPGSDQTSGCQGDAISMLTNIGIQ